MNQLEALTTMQTGRNCFLTGAAGAGKTYVLNQFIRLAKAKHKKIAVTASTGIAATHLNGNTIHSWSGIGTRESLNHWFFTKLPKSRRTTIESTDILIIDEISMLHAYYLDLIDEVCRRVRGELLRPFGGLQVILCGDFFQLPPVSREKTATFAYRARVWQEANFHTLYLTEQHRQDDADYLEILNAIRSANYRRHHIESLTHRINVQLKGDLTELHTHNFAVDSVNHHKLQTIKSPEQIFTAEHHGNKTYWEKLLNNILAPEELKLKVGALVMSVKNVPEKGFWNGSIGEIIDFSFDNYPIVKFVNGKTIKILPEEWNLIDGETPRATITQVPLRLAWAITVHKSQGMTLDQARIDLRRAFEPGMGYVALSRIKSLQGLSLLGINKQAIQVNSDVLKRDQQFRQQSNDLIKQLKPKELQSTAEELKKQELHFERLQKRGVHAPTSGPTARAVPHEDGRTPKRFSQNEAPASSDPDSNGTDPDSSMDPDSGKSEAQLKWAARVEKERAKWPNARKPWTLQDSLLLIELYLKGKTVPELSEKLGRKPRSIMMRINDSFATEIFTPEDGI